MGITKDEGLLVTADLLKNEVIMRKFNDEFESCLAINLLGLSLKDITEDEKKTAIDIAAFYGIKKETFNLKTDFHKLTDMFSDVTFSYGSDMIAR